MKNEMHQFLKSIVVFSIILVLFYVLSLCIWGDLIPRYLNKNLNYRIASYGHSYTRFNEVKNVKNVDILFLGSSHSYRGFDGRMFEKSGYSTFNLGSSAQTPLQTEILLKRYLKTLKPKMVVYEVFPPAFNIDGVESSMDIISNDINDKYSLKLAVKQQHLAVWNTLIYGFYRDYFNKNKKIAENKNKNNDTYISGGFVAQKLQYYKKIQYVKDTLFFNDSQLYQFKENIKLIQKQNIKIILVQAPITPLRYKSYTNNDYFDKKMTNIGTYYNFNKIISLNDSLHFFDDNHLNQNGVNLFNNAFIKKLQSKN